MINFIAGFATAIVLLIAVGGYIILLANKKYPDPKGDDDE